MFYTQSRCFAHFFFVCKVRTFVHILVKEADSFCIMLFSSQASTISQSEGDYRVSSDEEQPPPPHNPQADDSEEENVIDTQYYI